MSSFIPDDERIVTVEDAAELQLDQPHVLRLESRPVQRRGPGAGHDPRPGPQLPAHAPRPHHRRRGPRRGRPGHAPGDEHRPRRLAVDRARQHAARRPQPHRDHGPDGGHGSAGPRHPRAGRRRRSTWSSSRPACATGRGTSSRSPRSPASRATRSSCRTSSPSTTTNAEDSGSPGGSWPPASRPTSPTSSRTTESSSAGALPAAMGQVMPRRSSDHRARAMVLGGWLVCRRWHGGSGCRPTRPSPSRS